MNVRLVLVPAVVGGLLVGTLGASAAPRTLDGKRVKTLTATYTPAPQDNDADLVAGQFAGTPVPVAPGERVACKAPRCARLEFVYLPAKGVKGGLAFQTTWSTPGTDVDLYVAEIAKDGTASEIAHCGATAGTSEKIFLAGSNFRPGRKYAVITDFYRVLSDKVTTQVSFPGKDMLKTTVPSQADAFLGANCGL